MLQQVIGLLTDSMNACANRYHPDDAAQVQAAFEDCVNGLNGGVFDCTFRVVHRDGKVLHLHSHGQTTTSTDGHDRLVHTSSTCTRKHSRHSSGN